MTTASTYKELSEELDKVMRDLEQGDLDIDEAVKCYERGLAIVRELESHLKEAENKVTELKAATVRDIDETEEQ
jgi:exodeoxyribonuclease VII small subunit